MRLMPPSPALLERALAWLRKSEHNMQKCAVVGAQPTGQSFARLTLRAPFHFAAITYEGCGPQHRCACVWPCLHLFWRVFPWSRWQKLQFGLAADYVFYASPLLLLRMRLWRFSMLSSCT